MKFNYEEKGIKVKEFLQLMKEIFCIKEEYPSTLGLASFKRKPKPVEKKTPQRKPKDVKLSDLMRKSAV